jgi:type I restriction enzyme, S subunit
MDGWRKSKLIDIAAKKRWALNGGPFGSKLTTKHYTDRGVPVIRGTNLAGGTRFSFDDFVWVSEEKADELLPNNAHPGDLIFTQRGTIGQIGLIPLDAPFKRFVISQSQMKLTPDQEQADALFLYYYFSSPGTVKAIENLAFAAGVPHINLEILRSFEVPLPSLPVQRRIAGILSAYDELMENSQRRIRILEAMAHALYHKWFVRFRFPGHEKLACVASPLGDIPEGWEVKTVEEIVKRIPVGKKYEQKTVNPTGAIPVLDQGKSGIIGYHDEEPGVVASETAPVIVFANHTCYQRLIHFPFSAIQNVLPFVPSPSLPRNIYWLHWATNGLVVFNDYKGHWPEFAAKSLVVPTADVCQRFGDFVAPLALQILKLERAIENLRRTRDLLLPRLLSGQITVM